MKAVMISIQPKRCELIASGQKTIEIRKTAPKLDTPFKCYIYCTKDKYQHLYDLRPYTNGEISLSLTQHNKTSLVPQNYWNGKVIGEFVCDEVITLWAGYAGEHGDCCLTYDEMENYLGVEENGITNKKGYGWHISDLVIYDKPKELSEFQLAEYKYGRIMLPPRNITRPPQSWCYVEVVE